MPVIIDANRTGDFSDPVSGLAVEILSRLRRRTIRLVSGGKLHRELAQTRFRVFLLEAQRIGRLLLVEDALVNAEEAVVVGIGLTSDDPHIVALMRVTGCRLLYTDDNALIDDIGNRKLLSPPGCALKSSTPLPHARYHLAASAT